MDRLQAMNAFATVCDAKGFAPAARRLGLSPSVVTRLVGALEKHLGVRLLQRTTRSLHLTEAGARYLQRVRRVLGDIQEAEETARGDRETPRGRLAVAAPMIFGRSHVAPLLALYLARHAEVTAELHLNDRNVHLIDEGIDVAVRIGSLDDSTLVARRLGETRRVVVGAPAYLRKHGRPRKPSDLERHALIFFAPFFGAREWVFGGGVNGTREWRIPLDPRFASNSGDAAIDFAIAGTGLARVLLYQVMPHLAAGDLELVLEPYEPPPSPIHAVYPSARMLPAKVRAFVDLAAEAAGWNFRQAPSPRAPRRR